MSGGIVKGMFVNHTFFTGITLILGGFAYSVMKNENLGEGFNITSEATAK